VRASARRKWSSRKVRQIDTASQRYLLAAGASSCKDGHDSRGGQHPGAFSRGASGALLAEQCVCAASAFGNMTTRPTAPQSACNPATDTQFTRFDTPAKGCPEIVVIGLEALELQLATDSYRAPYQVFRNIRKMSSLKVACSCELTLRLEFLQGELLDRLEHPKAYLAIQSNPPSHQAVVDQHGQ